MTKPIRVALSGSGFRLGAHLGALQAIADAGYEVIELAGTSGGSIVASLYASGMPLDVLKELCMTLDWSPMMSFSPWALLTKQSFCSGNALLQFLEKLTGDRPEGHRIEPTHGIGIRVQQGSNADGTDRAGGPRVRIDPDRLCARGLWRCAVCRRWLH
jgi:predicted acylesterase/phospholipase RssA